MSPEQENAIDFSHFSSDVIEFVQLLHTNGVEYVVIGGEAVIYHGYPRFTGDIDFFFSDTPQNVRALFAALEKFWGGTVPSVHSAEELADPGVIFQFGRPPNRIDLLNRIDGVDFENAWKDRLHLRIASPSGDVPLFMINRENLVRNKKASARPKDLDDLRALG